MDDEVGGCVRFWAMGRVAPFCVVKLKDDEILDEGIRRKHSILINDANMRKRRWHDFKRQSSNQELDHSVAQIWVVKL